MSSFFICFSNAASMRDYVKLRVEKEGEVYFLFEMEDAVKRVLQVHKFFGSYWVSSLNNEFRKRNTTPKVLAFWEFCGYYNIFLDWFSCVAQFFAGQIEIDEFFLFYFVYFSDFAFLCFNFAKGIRHLNLWIFFY